MSKAKIKIDNRALTESEFKEFVECRRNPFFFAKFIMLIHPILGKIPFNLFPYQVSLLRDFLLHRFNIILKFRQAGVTELISLFCLWLAMYHPHKNIVIISIKDRVAKKVLRKIKFMYKNLPDHLKLPVVNGKGSEIGTQSELEFSNGSIISSIPTTEEAGRSEAVSLLVIDEAAIVRWAERIWAASFPTLSTGGRAIVNSCVTGDTEIVGKHGNFKIADVCPTEFGKKDISWMGLEVLSHTGQWRRVLGSVNKGKLETWEIRDRFGNTLKATPAHKLLTPQGWKPLQEIVDNNLRAIFYKTGQESVKEPPQTQAPHIKELRDIPGYPNYKLSNWGEVYCRKNRTGNWVLKGLSKNPQGYSRVSLWHKKKSRKFTLARLMWEVFKGPIPENYVIDHIDCNPNHNYITNLQAISEKENAKRAQLYSRGLKIGCKIGKGFANLEILGKIKDKYRQYKNTPKYLDLIIEEVYQESGIKLTRPYISRVISGRRNKTVHISKLKVVRKFTETIYDISVEKDESYITTSNYVNHNTPYGIGNFFHKTFQDAVAGGNLFNPVRLHWQMHPERDMNWYITQKEILGPRKTAQEIDGDFLTSGNTVFDLADIRSVEDLIEETEVLETHEKGLLKVIKHPTNKRRFTLGMDISTGRSQDYTAFTILDDLGEEYAYYKGKIPIDKAEKLAAKWGRKYNKAILAPESNDVGLGVAMGLQNNGYSRLYYSKQLLRKRNRNRPEVQEIPGWYTTKKNRPVIIAELEEDVRNGTIITCDQYFCAEAPTFIYDARNRPIAMNKDKNATDDLFGEIVYNDDAIFGKAIANHVRKEPVRRYTTAPK